MRDVSGPGSGGKPVSPPITKSRAITVAENCHLQELGKSEEKILPIGHAQSILLVATDCTDQRNQ